MSDQRNDLSMYREVQDQWSNLPDENLYRHLKRNEQTNVNGENFQNHQEYRMQNQYVHQNLYSPNVLYTPKTCDPLAESSPSLANHNNYNESVFVNQNPNYDVDNSRQNYGCVDLSNGQILDNNRPQYMVPNNNYELFNQDMSRNLTQQQCFPMMLNYMPPISHQHQPDMMHAEAESYNQANRLLDPLIPPHYTEVSQNQQTSADFSLPETVNSQYSPSYDRQPSSNNPLVDNFLGNWSSNPSGTYTPFGHSFLNVQPNFCQRDASISSNNMNANLLEQNVYHNNEPEIIKPIEQFNRKETETFLFSDTAVKKRIVAEVKPMRPSYSAVLSQTPKGQNTTDSNKKKCSKDQVKNVVKPGSMKADKLRTHFVLGDKSLPIDEKIKKSETGRKTLFQSQVSSGSESGETNNEFPVKTHKINLKNKTKGDNINRKWVSLDDLSSDNDPMLAEKPGYTNCDSEFVLVTPPEEKGTKKRNIKKHDGINVKTKEKPNMNNSESNLNDTDQYQENSNETEKLKRKNKDKSSNVTRKILSEKNKKNSQNRQKKSKGTGYMGKLQNYLDSWALIMKNVILWFYNLLSDIFRMSAQLSIDFFSITCKNTSLWATDIWILVKEKATSTEWLCSFGSYIDKKIGHTWFGFWRKLKWMNLTAKFEDEKDNPKKSNSNIPLPATGDDAMKRLLACKGKDPYSILGVGVQCSDENIKKYYRRQAFLVHPDKNQQPGAEEAFKILQHAFDLIGEPERREAYDRKLVESAHMEAAWSEVSELLAQLHDKVRHAAATIRCTNCSRRHARTLSPRPAYAARYCHQCKIHHAAKEGDIWAESSFWGFMWMYYACMDGAVYQITQWASCQKKNLKHLVANSHHVQYRIVLGSKSQQSSGPSGGKQSFSNSSHDANLEDFLNNLYTKAGQPAPGTTRNMPTASANGEATKNKKKTKKNKI